jgi:hypothetical protein
MLLSCRGGPGVTSGLTTSTTCAAFTLCTGTRLTHAEASCACVLSDKSLS